MAAFPAGLLTVPGAVTATSKAPDNLTDGGRPPDIFYICVDDLGTYLNCYGNDEVVSPAFDAFARDSVLFERAYCQVALCTASRTSILTGLRPETTGLTGMQHDWKRRLPGAVSLPEQLHHHGYDTINVGKTWDTRAGPGTRLGWTQRREPGGARDNRVAFEMIDRYLAGKRPTAYFIGYSAPHCPWNPAPEHVARYASRRITVNGAGRRVTPAYIRRCAGLDTDRLSEAQAEELTRRYYASVTEVDALVGELLARIDARGMYDNSIIVLWSGDHGYHLGQNDRWGKWTNHTAATRVPLLVRRPGLARGDGQRCPRVVECVDMYPTLLALTGTAAPPQHLDGVSLEPLLRDPHAPRDSRAYSLWGSPGSKGSSVSVKTERWNYIRYESGRQLLFDTIADPGEMHNVARAVPAQARLMDLWVEERFFGRTTGSPRQPGNHLGK